MINLVPRDCFCFQGLFDFRSGFDRCLGPPVAHPDHDDPDPHENEATSFSGERRWIWSCPAAPLNGWLQGAPGPHGSGAIPQNHCLMEAT